MTISDGEAEDQGWETSGVTLQPAKQGARASKYIRANAAELPALEMDSRAAALSSVLSALLE